jgi:hypothetical protein
MRGNLKTSSFVLRLVLVGAGVSLFALLVVPNYVRDPWTSPANACINNLRRIDGAKSEWELEHNAKTNDLVTINDIRPYLELGIGPNGKPYIKLDAKGNLPKCPSGGTYAIGKVGEAPTCSIGTNESPAHVLQ